MEKLRKRKGWTLGGLRKKKRSLADEEGAPVAGFGKEDERVNSSEMREVKMDEE